MKLSKITKLFKSINSRGLGITEIIVGIGLASVLLVIGGQILTMSTQMAKDISSRQGLQITKDKLTFYFNNSNSVRNTMKNNASMDCLDNNTNCSGQSGLVDIFNTDTTAPVVVPGFQSSVANEGLTPEGSVCATFPSQECPFKYNIVWVPECGSDATRCVGDGITYRFEAALQRAPNYTGPNFNLNAYRLVVSRSSSGEKAQDVCISLDGTYDVATRTCAVSLSQSCPAGQYFVGLNADNSKVCAGISATVKCPIGSVLWKIDSDGTFHCRSGCYIAAGFNCSINLWTGATDCPGDIGWTSGLGIVASGGSTAILTSDASAPPPPPPPPPPASGGGPPPIPPCNPDPWTVCP